MAHALHGMRLCREMVELGYRPQRAELDFSNEHPNLQELVDFVDEFEVPKVCQNFSALSTNTRIT